MRKTLCVTAVVITLFALVGIPVQRSAAQQVAADDRSDNDQKARVLEEVLARRVTVHLQDLSLPRAIEAIGASAGIRIAFNRSVLAEYPTRVTIEAKQLPLGTVFERVFAGTDLRTILGPGGQLAVVQDTQQAKGAHEGTLSGVVRNAKTKQPLRNASVVLDDNLQTERTDESGKYQFAHVTAGAHRLTVRFIGYERQTRPVTVADDQAMTADFAMEPSVNTLNQVVVTAAGAQRYRELGHVVSTINADSLVREAPITSLSELLTARVPGLAVYSGNGGVIGGNVALRLRGQTTTWLDPQPIVIVDGVRYKSEAGTAGVEGEDRRPFNAEPRSPLNDLNVNDIEKVEVVKGPSASTLYGPDAANGVILITTKHGAAGKTTWHVYAYPDLATRPQTTPTTSAGYRAWGHDPNTGETVNFNCTLEYQALDNQQCVLDSVRPAPIVRNDPRFSVLSKDRPQWHSGMSVSGGVPMLRYLFSGNYDSQVGSLQISPFASNFLKQQLGTSSLSRSVRTPNTQQTLSVRGSVSSDLNKTTSLQVAVNYVQATQRAIGVGYLWGGTSHGVLPLGVDTTDVSQLAAYAPTWAFLQSTEGEIHRWITSVQGTSKLFERVDATGNVGLDQSSNLDRGFIPAGATPYNSGGEADDYRHENTMRNASLRLNTTAHPGIFSFESAAGTDYVYTKMDGLVTTATNLAPGSSTVNTAQDRSITQHWAEKASLGFWGQEVIGLHDRMFVTGGLRYDGSSTFGDAYKPRPYPKVGASWILSDEPLFRRLPIPGVNEVRLRYSYGAASKYPLSFHKYGSVYYSTANINGQPVPIVNRDLLSNTLIRPERTRESEWGADINVASNVQIGLTWYHRRTDDEIGFLTVPTGFDRQWANIGDVAAHGFEGTVDVKVLETRRADLNITGTYSFNTNKLLSLGANTGRINRYGSIAAGYPLESAVGTSIVSFADTAGGRADGIIESSEVTVSSTPHLLGVLYPPKTYTVTPVLGLFGSRIRVSSEFDRQAGGLVIAAVGPGCGTDGSCIAQYLKSTPLATQANLLGLADASYLASSDFTRWREVSVTTDLSSWATRKIGLSRASVSLQGRNLKLWTKYKGPDPESVPGLGVRGYDASAHDAGGIPQPRTWAIRFDIAP